MSSYLTAFLWGVFVLLAMFGWGWLVLRICSFNKKIDLGWQGSLGLAFSVIAGGVFNYFQLVSKTQAIIFILLGCLIGIAAAFVNLKLIKEYFSAFWASARINKAVVPLLAVILFIVLIRFSLATAFFNFNGIDDYHAYAVYPVKMIQTGSIGQDPFSERQMLSSLGGQYFLHTFILAVGQLKNVHLIDNGAGFIIFLLVLYGLARSRRLSAAQSLLVVFLGSLIPSPSTNITSFFTSAAIFLACCRFILEAEFLWPKKYGRLMVLALLSASACALKSNIILPVVFIFWAYFISQYKSRKKLYLTARDLMLTTLLVFIFLLPWMLSMLQSSGTPLYPFFGKGNGAFTSLALGSHFLEFNVYSLYRLTSELIVGLGMFLPFAFLGWVWFKAQPGKSRNVALTVWWAAFLGAASLIYGENGYALYYYSFSFLVPSALLLLVLNWERGDARVSPGFLVSASGVGLAIWAVLCGVYIQQNIGIFQNAKAAVNIERGSLKLGLLNSELVPERELAQYENLQNSVPAGQIILARLDRNFLFDFKRNQIYLADSPGIVSPSPGMPYGKGSEALAGYLLEQKVRYVAYSYGNEANFGRANAGTMLRPHVSPLLRAETLASFDFQDNLTELGKTRKRIYDDGKNFVLDLTIKQ